MCLAYFERFMKPACIFAELGLTNYTEGDIAPEMEPGPEDHVRRRRAAIRNRNRLWPGGIVPYTLHYSACEYSLNS